MENRDEKLWLLASQRAKFKGNVYSYIAVNLFLWTVWFFTKSHHHEFDFIPWPAWVTLGWGFGLITKYIRIYHLSSEDEIQKEYDKLKNKNS